MFICCYVFVSGVMHFEDPKSSVQLSSVSTLHCMVECWLDAGLCRKCHRTKVWVHAKVPVSDVGHCKVKVEVIAKIPVLDVGHSEVIGHLMGIANAKSRLTCKHLMNGPRHRIHAIFSPARDVATSFTCERCHATPMITSCPFWHICS